VPFTLPTFVFHHFRLTTNALFTRMEDCLSQPANAPRTGSQRATKAPKEGQKERRTKGKKERKKRASNGVRRRTLTNTANNIRALNKMNVVTSYPNQHPRPLHLRYRILLYSILYMTH
jgi:hypothetical protein